MHLLDVILFGVFSIFIYYLKLSLDIKILMTTEYRKILDKYASYK